MPTKRVKRSPRRIAIPPEAIQAWRDGDYHRLHRALGLGPHQASPFDEIDAETATERATNGLVYYQTVPKAVELRKGLIAIAGEPGAMDRHGRPVRRPD